MRLIARILPWLVALLPTAAYAQNGSEALADYIQDVLFNEALNIAAGFMLLFIFYYGFRLILESQDEGTIATTKKSFIFAVIGFAILASAGPITAMFNPNNPNAIRIFEPAFLQIQLRNIMDYIFIVAQGVFILLTVFHGLRLLASGGDQGAADAARKGIVMNVIGAILILMASIIEAAVSQNDPTLLAVEIAGLASFVVTLTGALAALALIVAGVILIVSVDESYKDKAKNIVIGTIIALVIMLISYVAIQTFTPTTTFSNA